VSECSSINDINLHCWILTSGHCLNFFFDEHCPIHDPYPVEHEKSGTNRRFCVKGVGVVIGHSSQKRGFSKIDLRAPEGEETTWHALGTPSDECDSVRIGSSGLRIEWGTQ